jgi:PAS domain-containing protein
MTTPWIVTDVRGKCIYVNPAAEVFCGIDVSLDKLGNLASLQQPAHEVGKDALKIDLHEVPWSLESQMHFDTYLPYSHNSSFNLLDAFAGFLSRICNFDELC